MCRRHREQARSHRDFGCSQDLRSPSIPPVGASLLAIAVGQLASMVYVLPSSRASPAPTEISAVRKTCVRHHSPCGSEPARDSGGPACVDVVCAAVIAGKPGSHRDFGCSQDLRSPSIPPVGASPLAIAVGQLASMLYVPPSSRASPAPTEISAVHKTRVRHHSLCGSELARDSGGSACIDVVCAAVIASRLAPTWVLRWLSSRFYPCVDDGA